MKWITWTGLAWRDYVAGDESLPNVIRCPFVRMGFGEAALDPATPVVTLPGSRSAVESMHERFRRVRVGSVR